MKTRITLSKYDELVEAIRKIEGQTELFGWFGNGPQGIRSVWPDGMPYRTNEPEAALLQREDLNEALDLIENLYARIKQLKENEAH